MYLPEVFDETRPEVLWDLMARHPLGLLITAGPEGPMASPLPFLGVEAEGRLRLTCHLARPNPHLEALAGAGDCLVVFQGAEAYVTPSWYPSKAETERVTPTWNYQMVQVRDQDADGAARGLADPNDPNHDPDVAAIVAERLRARVEP